MQDYLIILQIIISVLDGKNLTEVFNNATLNNDLKHYKIKDICYGIFSNYYRINYYLRQLVKVPPDEEQIDLVLKVAIYEILFTKKPDHAVTNDMVNLIFEITNVMEHKSFVNAVLRNFIRKKNELKFGDLESKYDMPLWFINKLKQNYKHNYVSILQNCNLEPKLGLRINRQKITQAEYVKLLEQTQISYIIKRDKIVCEKIISVDKIPLFYDGSVSIQDIAAQELIDFYDIPSSSYVLDACSAPGGKACQILENKNVKLLALDIDKNRLNKVKDNLYRLQLDAQTKVGDASNLLWWDKQLFDVIIADVPCSATGTIKRNPDIKLHRTEFDIECFVITQRKIVLNLWQTLKYGGSLVYITCSILKEENQENIQFFINNLDGAVFLKELQILPTQYNDGFYYCLISKQLN